MRTAATQKHMIPVKCKLIDTYFMHFAIELNHKFYLWMSS